MKPIAAIWSTGVMMCCKFPFNEEVHTRIKEQVASTKRSFNPTTKTWSVGKSAIVTLVSILSEYYTVVDINNQGTRTVAVDGVVDTTDDVEDTEVRDLREEVMRLNKQKRDLEVKLFTQAARRDPFEM